VLQFRNLFVDDHVCYYVNTRKQSYHGRNCTRSGHNQNGNWHVTCRHSSFLFFRAAARST